ncbi:aminopeptidase P family protein [Ruegeria meonggei]|uniref:Aminopeptidase n=1 Tax=Ruegeria meonggei TaxID=1446476 RepID=A0A1X6YZQ0_9RHOB|nr:aminopeptidase P family protein [Ruegeria meonggei]SLN36097.1 Aminopeptidase [Ruegeria meonggei]
MLKRLMPMLDAPETKREAIITALRAELQAQGLDAFILPRYDAHQAEYLAPHDERLAYVTGFTGTAGMAVVTMDTVALFVDGRYVVQAANQCPSAQFTHLHLFDDLPEHWLAERAQPGWRIGFDAMHLSPVLYDRFANALQRQELTPVAKNPVDAVWPDQPPIPMGRVEPFPVQFSGKPSGDKIDDLVAGMRRFGAGLLVETQPDNIAWLLNVRGADVALNPVPHSFLMVDVSGQVLWFVAPQKLDQSVTDHLPDDVQLCVPEAFLPSLEARAAVGQGVMFDPEFSPEAVRIVLQRIGADQKPRPSLLTTAKTQKNPTEIEGMRACHIADGIAWTEFCAWLAATVPERANMGNPVTEREAELAMQGFRREQSGFLGDSFNPISAADGNAAMCHYATQEGNVVPLVKDGTYLLDSGGQFETGTTDATRSFAFGPNRPDGYDRAYTAVFKAFHALCTLRFPPGTQGHHIDAICRRPLWDLGLDYDHGTGHGVGHRLSVHEHPQRIGKPYNPVDLAPGMILSIEPGYYETDRFGIRIENLFEITQADDGFMTFSNMTWCPIQTDMLVQDLLTQAEREWLNSYHTKLLQRIGPRLSPSALEWAREACASLT